MTKILKNIGFSLAIPLVVYGLCWLLCLAFGKTDFAVGLEFTVILRTTIYTGLISLAFSLNLSSGRFDFSIGSIIVLSSIIGAGLAKSLKLPAIGMLACFLLTGALLGMISGLIYTTLKIPTMVCSLGVAMIFESMGFIISGGDGIRLIGKNHLLIFSSQPYIYMLGAGALIILIYLTRFTRFGYEYQSLRAGQEIAVEVGIREKRNAVICYIISGVLLASAGIINISITGTCAPAMGLSTSSYMMNAFLPMFIGEAIGKYSDRNIGVMIGAFTQAMLISAFVKIGLGTSLQTLLNAIIVMGFLFYSSNKERFHEQRLFKEKELRLHTERIQE